MKLRYKPEQSRNFVRGFWLKKYMGHYHCEDGPDYFDGKDRHSYALGDHTFLDIHERENNEK